MSESLLENLDAEKREGILEMATEMARLSDMLEPLKSNGIEVSLSALTRFVRRHRETKLMADGEDMKGAVEALSKRGRGETFRKGTIEAMRQRLYELSLETNDPEEARKFYGELLREEEKLKELELAQRRMALAEEQTRLQQLRIELQAGGAGQNGRGRGRRKVPIELAPVEVSPEKGLTDGNGGDEGGKEKELLELLLRLEATVNKGGALEEKVLAARELLAEGLREWRGNERKAIGNV